MSAEIPTEDFRLTIDEVCLELRRWEGCQPPVLLLHEGLGSLSMWRDFPRRLAEVTARTVIAWSRQGHGNSDRLRAPRNTSYMHEEAEVLLKVMDSLRIEHAILFGHSDGASIALIAAARAPERVSGLILEAPHVYVEALTVASIAAIGDMYRTSALGRKLARYHADANHVFWAWNDIWLDERFLNWNIESLLACVRAPALLVQGTDDEYGTLDQLVRIEAGLADTERLVLPDCGHPPHKDQPEAVLHATAKFLAERVGLFPLTPSVQTRTKKMRPK